MNKKGYFNRIAKFTAVSLVILTLISLIFLWPGISQESISSNTSLEEMNDSLLNGSLNESVPGSGSGENTTVSNSPVGGEGSGSESGGINSSSIGAQIDVDVCPYTLNTANGTYDLTQNLVANGTCITIAANNTTFNGNGYTINYSRDDIGYGIFIKGANNTLIKNARIFEHTSDTSLSHGINAEDGVNLTISNVTIRARSTTSYGIYLNTMRGSHYIANVTVNTTGLGASAVRETSTQNITLSGANLRCSGDALGCVHICNSANNTILNSIVTINGSGSGASEPSAILANTAGIRCSVVDTVLNASNADSVELSLASSALVNLTNVTLINNRTRIAGSARLNVHWHLDVLVNSTNGSAIASANVTAWNVSNAFSFSELTNASGRLARRAVLEYSRNATSTAYYNNYTINVTADRHLRISRSVNISTNRFEVFTLKEINLTACQTLDEANTVYLLTQNVSSNLTCFTITANNVTLDGQGYKVTYGNGTTLSIGIDTIGGNRTTIKNLVIEQRNSSGTYNFGVNFESAVNMTIMNNTIRTNGSFSHGIRIIMTASDPPSNSTISGNTIITSDAMGIAFFSSPNSRNTFSDNNITTNTTTQGSMGIYLDASNFLTVVRNNIIRIFGNNSYGLDVQSDNASIFNNTITTSANLAHGINLIGSNNTFSSNVITTTDRNSAGIIIVGVAATGNVFNDSRINASHASSNDTQFSTGTSGTLNFTNVTLVNNKTSFIGTTTSRLNVHWYMDVFANYTNGTLASNVNVTARNVSGAVAFSRLTNSSGRILRQRVLDYWRNASTLVYQNNYSVNASIKIENLTQSVNVSTNRFLEFTFGSDTVKPNVSFVAPTPANGTSTDNTTIQVNVSLGENALKEFIWNWNGTNYSFYDSTLDLMFNFDNVSALGENSSLAVDVGDSPTNGTVSGAIFNSSGRYGGAYQFSSASTDVVNVGGYTSVPSSFTLFAWVYQSSNPTYDAEIINMESASTTYEELLYDTATDKVKCIFTLNGPAYATVYSATTLPNNEWVHVACRGNSENLSIYINGAYSDSAVPSASPISTSGSTLQIGNNRAKNRAWVGLIDEIRIYVTALSDASIQQHYYSNLYKYETNSWSFITNQSNLSLGNYTFFASALDTGNNRNTTETRTITITDTTAPLVTVNQPTGNSSTSSVTFNVTLNEDGNCRYTLNSGTTNYTMQNNGNRDFNHTNSSIADGSYTARFYCNDTSNNLNSSVTRGFTVDTTRPAVTIVQPQNITYNINMSLSVNYTVADTNLQACFWSLDGGVNTTITCGQNASVNVSQGSHTVRVYANDTLGNLNGSSAVTFSADSVFPTLNYGIGADNDSFNISRNWIFVNVSVTEANFANITFRLYNTTSNVNTTTFTTQTFSLNFTSLNDGFYTFNVTVVDTASNSNVTATRGVRVDTTFPGISYGTGTEDDGTNFTRNWTFVNVSVTESNFANITFRLYNEGDALVNSTTYSSQTFFINFTSLSDGLYKYNVTVSDGASNRNSTATRSIRLDNNGPAVRIIEPKAQTYSTNVSLAFNHTVSDAGVGVSACWWAIDAGANTTVTCGANITFNTSQGSHTLRFYANDTLNNANSSSVTFSVNSSAPSVQLAAPDNSQWLSYKLNIYFNYTPTDSDGISMCRLYGNWTGSFAVNQTNTSLANATSNFFIANLTAYADASYLWNVECNDTSNNMAFGLNNFTFNIDTLTPGIDYASNADSSGINASRNWIFVNVTVTESNFANITFRLYNTTSNVNTTTFTTQTFSLNFTSLNDGFYTFNVTVVDTASNSNVTATRGVRVDTTLPAVTIVQPQNITYNINMSLSVNYTVADTNLQACFWSLDGGVNTTITCGQNASVNVSQGSHTVRVYANDSAGNVNGSSSVTFFSDSVFPGISYGEGVENDGANLSRNWIFVNVTVTESNFANITFRLYNSSQAQINATDYTTQIYFINFTSLSEGTYYYNVSITDTANNRNTTSRRAITLDTTNPNASLISPLNGTFGSNATQNLTVNITDNIEIRNTTLFVYNASDSLVNQTTAALSGTQRLVGIVYTFVVDGIFRWFYRIVDTAGNLFFTGNNTITIDTINPKLFADNYSTSNGTAGIVYNTGNPVVRFFVNATDTNLQSVVLEINYTSVYQNLTRLTTPNVQQIGDRFEVTFQAGQGIDNRENISWRWHVNDSAANRNSTSLRNFIVTNRAPEKPSFNVSNDTFMAGRNISLRINIYDPDSDNISFFVYNSSLDASNFRLYYSVNNSNFTTFNFTNLAEGKNYFYAVANDSTLASSTLSNTSDTLLLTVDTLIPTITNITSPSVTSVLCSLTSISLAYTVNDTNIDYCVYNVTQSGSEIVADTNLSACGSTTFDVSSNGNYTIGLLVYDKAGNSNTSYRNFSVNTSASSCSSGGGSSLGGGGAAGAGGSPKKKAASQQKQEDLEIEKIGEVVMAAGESKALSAKVTYTGNRTILNNCKLSGDGEYASWISPSKKEEDISQGEIVEYPFTLRVPRDIGPGSYDLGLKVKCLELEAVSSFMVTLLQRDLLIELINVNKSGNLLEIVYMIKSNTPGVQKVSIEYWLSDQDKVNLTRGDDYIELEQGKPVTRKVILDVHNIKAGEYILHIVGTSEAATFTIEEPVLIPKAGSGLGQVILGGGPGTLALAFIMVSSFVIFAIIIIRRIIRMHRLARHPARSQRGVVKIKMR